MRPRGTAGELEVRRRIGGRLLAEGESPAEVARLVGVSWTSAKRWKVAVDAGGIEALKAKPHPPTPCRLTPQQQHELVDILLRGPEASGFGTDLWTCPRVASVIRQHFGVAYHVDHVGRLLHSFGWTCQKPEHRSRKRDEEEIQRWRVKEWPRIKREAKKGEKAVLAVLAQA